MDLQRFSNLKGQHALFSASKPSWIRYDISAMKEAIKRSQAAARGTRLHALAEMHINEKIRMPRTNKTLDRYINDAISYQMTPEQVLYFSPYFFGTADAFDFDEDRSVLRIHDLKTGTGPVHMDQLLIYAAYFCLQTGIKPGDIETVLRIYQNDDIQEHHATAEEIAPIMDKAIEFNDIIRQEGLAL